MIVYHAVVDVIGFSLHIRQQPSILLHQIFGEGGRREPLPS